MSHKTVRCTACGSLELPSRAKIWPKNEWIVCTSCRKQARLKSIDNKKWERKSYLYDKMYVKFEYWYNAEPLYDF